MPFMYISFFFSSSSDYFCSSLFYKCKFLAMILVDTWKYIFLWLCNIHWTLGKNEQIILYLFSCLHQFVQSTDNKAIYTHVWQDKGFLFLKHGRDGKTCYFLNFMNSVPATRLPLPPHSYARSPALQGLKNWLRMPHSCRLQLSFWSQEVDWVMLGEGKANPESNYYYCASRNEKPDTLLDTK